MAQPAQSDEKSRELLDERYSRQILFRGIGEAGQRKLAAARAVIVGCGATGSAVAATLARSGVGYLRILDRDYVELSNLQRQVLFDESDAEQSLPKAVAAAQKIATFNSDVKVEAHVADLVPANIETLLADVDLILDATDNFETRYLINDYAVKYGRPWIYAAAVGSYGLTMNILPGETACLSCIFPAAPQGLVETCDTSGILNPAVQLVASVEATEALKFFVGAKQEMRRSMLSFDLWTNQRSELKTASPRADCATCGARDFPFLAGEGRPQITLCGRNAVQIHERNRPVSFADTERRLAPHGKVRFNDFVLKFWYAEFEVTLFPDGRAIIKGTTDPGLARSLYARFFGS